MTKKIIHAGPPDEEAIIASFRQGRLELFYKKVYPSILLFAGKFLDDRTGFLAEDCVQDAVFDAWKRRGSFPSLAALKAFLYTSIRNDAVSISRKEQARQRYLSLQDEEVVFNTAVIDQETLALLHAAINALPPREREVLQMNFIEGLKVAEVAGKLSLSESSVKKYKANALRILREKLPPVLCMIFFRAIS
jgi:RNA polymerase sigma-70 factor (ECF subfamily)